MTSEIWDFSNYDSSSFNENEVRTLISITPRCIMGTQNVALAQPMLELWRVSGGECRYAYEEMYHGEIGGLTRCQKLIDFAKVNNIPFVWAVSEQDADGASMTPQQRVDEIQSWAQLAHSNGLGMGLCTNESWLDTQLGGFSLPALWLSYYGKDDGSQPPVTEYNGHPIALLQYWSAAYPNTGRGRDISYIINEPIKDGDIMGQFDAAESGLSDADRIARLERIVAGYGIKDATGNTLSGEDALKYADSHNDSLLGGIAQIDAAIVGVEKAVEGVFRTN